MRLALMSKSAVVLQKLPPRLASWRAGSDRTALLLNPPIWVRLRSPEHMSLPACRDRERIVYSTGVLRMGSKG